MHVIMYYILDNIECNIFENFVSIDIIEINTKIYAVNARVSIKAEYNVKYALFQ